MYKKEVETRPQVFSQSVLYPAKAMATGAAATVILLPRHGSFQTKMLEVRDISSSSSSSSSNKGRVRIGRQTSSKAVALPYNGLFDSKVLSRIHAELWYEQGKVYIRDIKSSNGTFLNGRRLSDENEESEPFELKSTDTLEFGVDITNEDGSILYHKVSCQVQILPTALAQIDSAMFKELNEGLSCRRQNPPLVMPETAMMESNWQLLMSKLQQELHRSKDVEYELKKVKCELALTLEDNKRLSKADDRARELEAKLHDALTNLASYTEKCQHQDEAIASAKLEVAKLEETIHALQKGGDGSVTKALSEAQKQAEKLKWMLEEQEIRLNKDLSAEKARCLEFEERCLQLERKIQELEQRKRSDTSSSSPSSGGFYGFWQVRE
ncbi:SMAD/FHA domain-containing protein [Dichotomocladium elegans]|nr:SMAD/FHA domain-containing protein [Dichotomocladium elegans]